MKLFLTFMFCCLFNHGMAYPDSLRAISHKEKALEFLKLQDLDSSYYHQTEALKIFKENHDLFNWINVFRKVGKTWRDDLNNPAEAISNYTRALNEKWSPNTEKTWKVLAWLYANRAYAYGEKLGNYKKALEDYKAAHIILTDTLKKNDFEVATYIDNRLGNVCTRLGEIEDAIYYLNNSIQILLAEERPINAALASCDLGLAYYTANDYTQAIKTYQQALKFSPLNANAKGILLLNWGFTLYRQKNYAAALEKTLLGKQQIEIAIQKKQHRFSSLHLSKAYTNLALIHQAQKKWDLAQQYFEKNLAVLLDYYPSPYNREISKIYCRTGHLFLEQNKTQQALDYFQKALQSVLPDFKYSSFLEQPDKKTFYAENAIYEALEGKAQALQQWAIEQPTQATVCLKAALECYEFTNLVEQKLRQTYENESSKLIAQEKSQQRMELAIATALKLYRHTEEKVYFEKAFHWSESSKNLVLLEQLLHHQATLFADIPTDLLEQEQQIKQQLSYYQQELFNIKNNTEKPVQEDIQELEKRIFQLKKSHQAHLSQLKNYPAYQYTKSQDITLDLAHIQKELAPQQVLISYFYGDSTIYIFCISKDDFFVIENQEVSSTTQKIQAFSELITQKSLDQYRKKSNDFPSILHQLHQLLLETTLARLDASISELLIIPDKQLGYVPFEFLLQTDLQEATFLQADFSLNDYTISYAYSTTLFLQQKNPLPTIAPPYLFAGFAPQYQKSDAIVQQTTSKNNFFASFLRSGQYNLVGAKKEVETIASLLNGDSFVHQQATEETFKTQASNYRILHLAMHSLVEDNDHLFSKLLFTENPTEDKEDSYLHAIELYNMRLNAELAVLSACNTGYGKVSKGEGIMSLSRAFHYAGVPATVMSLWKVPDKQTADIMTHFYKNLKAGLSKDVALRQAKLTYLEQVTAPELAHPFYWAGFIVVGNTDAIDMGNHVMIWCLGMVGGMLLLGLYLKYLK